MRNLTRLSANERGEAVNAGQQGGGSPGLQEAKRHRRRGKPCWPQRSCLALTAGDGTSPLSEKGAADLPAAWGEAARGRRVGLQAGGAKRARDRARECRPPGRPKGSRSHRGDRGEAGAPRRPAGGPQGQGPRFRVSDRHPPGRRRLPGFGPSGLERGPQGRRLNLLSTIPGPDSSGRCAARVPCVFGENGASVSIYQCRPASCYSDRVRNYSGHRRAPRRSAQPADPVTALRAYAVKLHDKGDGHGVNWARVAASLVEAGMSCLRELPHDNNNVQTVARRAHDAAYSVMMGSPDSGTPYTADRPEAPPFTADAEPNSDFELNR